MDNTTFEQRMVLLGKRVNEVRQYKNITINELSKKSGLSTRYIKKIENGQALNINIRHVYLLYKSLELVSIYDLLYFY